MSNIFSTSFRSGRSDRTVSGLCPDSYLSLISSDVQDSDLISVIRAVRYEAKPRYIYSQENLNIKLTSLFLPQIRKRFYRFESENQQTMSKNKSRLTAKNIIRYLNYFVQSPIHPHPQGVGFSWLKEL